MKNVKKYILQREGNKVTFNIVDGMWVKPILTISYSPKKSIKDWENFAKGIKNYINSFSLSGKEIASFSPKRKITIEKY